MRNYKLLFVLLFLSSYTLFAQDNYKGKVLDSKTGESIPYVNIGVIDKGIGTVSDLNGDFILPFYYHELNENNRIEFSSLGYQSITLSVTNLRAQLKNSSVLKMSPSLLKLDEVVVSNKRQWTIPESIGYLNLGEKSYGYWKENSALEENLQLK